MPLNLSIVTWTDQFVNIQVDATTAVSDVKAILEAETSIPAAQQLVVYGTRLLSDSETLGACGVSDGDVLQVVPAQAAAQGARGTGQQQQRQQPRAAAAAPGVGNPMDMNPDGSARNPEALMAQIKGNPHMMASLEENNPRLAKALRESDVAALQETLRAMASAKAQQDAELQRLLAMAEEDPLNPELQAKIEEAIHQKNIQDSYENAMEHAPETVVGQVHMLYCDMEVNGVKTKCFIDSGAQMTIMTQDFAEKCYLTRLIDKRFHGMAHGVGSSRIIGRIHQAPMKVGGHYITTSITVLEQKSGPQFIFGLDNLKRHLCCIDLKSNVLAFGSCDARLPFLGENDIPVDFSQHVDKVSEEEAKRNMESGSSGPPPQSGASAATPSAGPQAAAAAASPAPAAAAAAAAAGAPAAGGGQPAGQPSGVERLMAFGFSREQCEAALRMAGGNEDVAASVLFDM